MSQSKNKNFHFSRRSFIEAMINASDLLSKHKEDVNRLNVFPVPDGDTGTNMSLTLESVIEHLKRLGANCSVEDIRRAVTTGALMGARGNSGVILSQILRGLCEGYESHEFFDTEGLATAFTRAEEVAFAAVRKPVEGTILTVLKDSAKATRYAFKKKMTIDQTIKYVSDKAYESVENTPNLLPVLKENGVVDAGGYGLAIFIEGIASGLTGEKGSISIELENAASENYQPKVEIEQINDWAGSKFRYCNEFLVDSNSLNPEETLEFLASIGDCELCVGAAPKFKVHVHSDNPDKVLHYFLARGQVSEVFIHNMQLQSEDRTNKLSQSDSSVANGESSIDVNENCSANKAPKEIGIVAVAVGKGNSRILKSLGVDVIVSGGQTMNPSTKDLCEAAKRANAKNIIFLPNNKNIIMAAKSACEVMENVGHVLETKNLPSAFAALMMFDADESVEDNLSNMNDAFEDISTAEVTVAIKDSKDAYGNPIKKGDTIGICEGDIISTGKSTFDVVYGLLSKMNAEDKDMLTVLRGENISEKDFKALVSGIEDKYPDLEIDSQDGGQPLYPIIFSLE